MIDRIKCGAKGRFSRLSALYIGDGRWKVEREFHYFHDSGLVIVPKDFITDFDSVPRLPLVYLVAKDRATKSALAHDALYRFGKLGGKRISRKQADDIFYDAMRHEGLPWRHRATIYSGVRLGGLFSWRKHRKAG